MDTLQPCSKLPLAVAQGFVQASDRIQLALELLALQGEIVRSTRGGARVLSLIAYRDEMPSMIPLVLRHVIERAALLKVCVALGLLGIKCDAGFPYRRQRTTEAKKLLRM